MFLHKLYVGKHRFQSILFLYLKCSSSRKQPYSEHMTNKERPKRDFLPTNCAPFPFTFGQPFFPRPLLLQAIPFLITHQPLFFPLQKTTSLDPLYPLCPYIALLSWQFLFHCSFIVPFSKPPPHILLYPSRLFQSMTCLCPFSILFPDPFACHLTSFRLLPYCYFRRIFLFVLSDTRTVSISECVLYFILISLSEDWQTE